MNTDEQAHAECANCGGTNIRGAYVRSAFWHNDRLVVVEDIPALVCEDCNEQFYGDHAVVMLDLLRGNDFPLQQARGELRVPIFSLRDQLPLEARP